MVQRIYIDTSVIRLNSLERLKKYLHFTNQFQRLKLSMLPKRLTQFNLEKNILKKRLLENQAERTAGILLWRHLLTQIFW